MGSQLLSFSSAEAALPFSPVLPSRHCVPAQPRVQMGWMEVTEQMKPGPAQRPKLQGKAEEASAPSLFTVRTALDSQVI